MATYYVYSGAVGAADGSSWTDAYTTLAAALSGKSAGQTYLIAHDHSESTGSALTLAFPGSTSAPDQVYSVNRATGDIVTSPTAVIATTGNSNLIVSGHLDAEGIIWRIGSGSTTNLSFVSSADMLNCKIDVVGLGSGTSLTLGSQSQKVVLDNTPISFATVGDGILATSMLEWRNTPNALPGAAPTYLMVGSGTGRVAMDGVDLSAMGSGSYMAYGGSFYSAQINLHNCKIGAGVSLLPTSIYSYKCNEVVMTRCDSGTAAYRHEKQNYLGIQTVETTIVRSGGASDGTTALSWKIATTAGAKFKHPFRSFPLIPAWISDTGSPKTLTVYGVWAGGAVPNDDDIWIEIEYLGDATSPCCSFVSSAKASRVATSAPVNGDTSTWGGGATAFKMSVSFTPALAGHAVVRVYAAKPSSTFYIDPKPVIV